MLTKNSDMIDKTNYIKGLIKLLLIVFVIWLLSIVAANIIKPIKKKSVSNSFKEEISGVEYESDKVSTESVLSIDTNEDALLWRLRMIGNAKESITMATFDLRMDESGLDVISALYDAAERGVKVKVLIDGIYEPLYLRDDTFYAFCSHENVEVKLYNPITFKGIYNINYRMHDKYLMVDECMYLLGGRNTTDTFWGELRGGSNIDRELLVYNSEEGKGDSFLQLENYFEQIWKEDCVQTVSESVDEDILLEEKERFLNRYEDLLEEYEDFSEFDDWHGNTWEANKITLIANETEATNKEPRVLYMIGQLADGADEVIIQTPYAICNKYMYSVLHDMGEHADLKIMLNAVERGSNPWGCTDYLNNKEKILDTGTDIYELMNEYAVHTKTVLIDNNLSIVGSFNLDMRSTYLDTELMLVVDSEPLNAYIRQQFEQYKEKSVEVLSDGTETVGSMYQEKEMTARKKVMYSILRVIIRPFRYLL